MTLAEPVSIATARKPFRKEGLGYVWELADRGVELRADYISQRSNELHAQVSVTLRGKHLHMANFNLSSTVSRKTLRVELATRTNGLELPWEEIVEQFCVGVLGGERLGQPTQFAAAADKRRLAYLVDHLVIKGKTNMLFAPGGSGKGMLCCALCCAVAGRKGFAGLTVAEAKPFYFDWEDDFATFEDRLNMVARGMGIDVPPIPYRRMRGLAADRINEIARALGDAGANFGIIDSFSAAGGTVSDRTSWDTIAHRLFDALDLIPDVTWLLIDHVTGDSIRADPTGKAYGSIQKMNRVRNAWEMRSDQEPGAPTVHLRLYDAKWNHTGKRKPIGISMEFSDDRVTFTGEDPTTVAQQLGATLADKMALELERGPLSDAVLAIGLGVSKAAIRSEISRRKDRFARDERGFVILRSRDDEEDLPW